MKKVVIILVFMFCSACSEKQISNERVKRRFPDMCDHRALNGDCVKVEQSK